MDNEEKLKRIESIKENLLNSRLGKFCLDRFTREINVATATHSEIFEWFKNYLSHSVYAYNLVMFNITSVAMKKEIENEVDEEFLKDLDNTIELMTELRTVLKK